MEKILIVHPDFSRLGGIENYFRKISPNLKVTHESLGNSGRPDEKGLIDRLMRILSDYYRYWVKLSETDIDIVHLNPSLEPRMFYRESIFLLLARLRRKKILVFFHGWNTDFQQKIDAYNGIIFRLLYGKADAFIVLASAFTEKLQSWGVTQPIYTEVIVIEDEVVANFDLEKTLQQRMNSTMWQLLFPARLMRSKGILTTIKALKIVQQSCPQFGLLVAGDGEHAEEARNLVIKLGVDNVTFFGIVTGDKKYELFRSANILCFPTEHSEGFPNTIVEAMALGLPVLTRPVGGIPDFFRSGIHGYLTESTSPEDFAKLIIRVSENLEHYQTISRNNHDYAKKHFLASQAAANLENIYKALRNNS